MFHKITAPRGYLKILLRNDGFQTILILGTHFPDGVLLTVIFNPAKQFLLLAMEAIKHYLYIAFQHLVGTLPGSALHKTFLFLDLPPLLPELNHGFFRYLIHAPGLHRYQGNHHQYDQ